MIGMFASIDILLFYIFLKQYYYQCILIIGIWGGKEEYMLLSNFFFYTFLGSVLMLIAIIVIYQKHKFMNIENYKVIIFQKIFNYYLWLAFFASFAVKIPMWPFHTWLPDAHVEAPTAGSVILAGVF